MATDKDAEEQQQQQMLARHAANFFEKYERYDCQELLAYSSTHWMLSSEDFRLPTDPPAGIISTINPIGSDSCLILMEEVPDVQPMDYRELHQIVRELTYGIYVLNQTPFISLEVNYDQSSSVQLPPAFMDTRVGQTLTGVDYMMKALWHGAYIPRDKRTKFSERWRTNLDVNSNGKPETKKILLTEFTSAGLLDICKDPDYANAYDKLPVEQPGDAEMAEERRFFMSHVDELSMSMTFYQEQVSHHQDLYIAEPKWLVSSIVRMLDDNIDHTGYERLKTRLQMHEELIKEHLCNKGEVRRQVELIKFISYLTPFLIGMRKRMKIPDINRLVPALSTDETRTERELPPLILGSDFKCKNFTFGDHYFPLHGGIKLDLETSPILDLKDREDLYSQAQAAIVDFLKRIEQETPNPADLFRVPTVTYKGTTYFVVKIDFETYYGQMPQKPTWVRMYTEEIARLKPKKLPITDIYLHEQFKKYFGYKKAIKYKTPANGLKAAAQRGLIAMFQTLCRKMPASRLNKQDEQGLSLIHHAAIFNRPNIITCLLLQSMDVNVRRNAIMATGPTALHMAARCGSLDAVSCLIANYANILAADQSGWAPIHHAAFFDHEPVIKLMVRKNQGLVELPTKNDLRSTPLLLAASSGGLAAVKCLIALKADVTKQDSEGNNMVVLAALRFHTNVLEYLILWNNKDVPVWEILVNMLRSDNLAKQDSAVKCLEVLSTSKPDHWFSIKEAGGVSALVGLLKLDNEEIQSVAASVLCNISEHDEIRIALTTAKAGPILIKLLSSPVDDIQSRAAIILSDLACIEGNQDMVAEAGGIEPLIALLESELEDVLVNAVNAVRVLSINNKVNQNAVAKCGGLEPLVEFLTVNSDILQAATAAAIAAVVQNNKDNQDAVIDEGAAKPLVDLIKGSRNITVQVKAASAIEFLAQSNIKAQRVFLDLDAPKSLLRLLKNINVEVREQGACSLWALAGHTNTQQKYIAERMGIPHIIQMLLEPTEKLLTVGCMTAIALGRENTENQNKLAGADAFQQLVRLLRSHKTPDNVVLMVIKVLGILCVGVAYRNNKVTQRKILEEGGIPILVQLLLMPPNMDVQVEVAITLACVVLGNRPNQEKLSEEPGFRYDILLDLLHSSKEETRLKAGMALAIFAFNNTPQQFMIREAGGIKYSAFVPFLKSPNEFHECKAAFQIVVLARVITDMDQVALTAKGITQLVAKLRSGDPNVVMLSASLLSSLAHTRAGIPDAMITTGAIDLLIMHLYSNIEQVRNAVAVALGYLTFNKTASRLLFSACRNTPELYKKLMDNIGTDARICQDFVQDFRHARIVGLPSQCVHLHAKPTSPRAERQRPKTTMTDRRSARKTNRAVSAPAGGRSTRIATVVLDQSEDEEVRRSVASHRPVSTSSQLSGKPSTTDSSFKTHLSSWKTK